MLRITLALIAFAALQGAPTTTPPAEEFTANYLNVGNVGATGATPVTIRITRWTPDEENAQLMDILREKGTEAFARALQNAKQVGSLGIPQTLPRQLFYARQQKREDGGRQIVLASDRPMSFEERTSSSVARDYPITWIQLQLDKEGKGEGTIALAARLKLVGNYLGVEDLANQPARLAGVRKIK